MIRGPGRVIIGDNVTVGMVVTPFTYSSGAVISVGGGTFLNGTRFGCRERIDIGPRCILAECRIMDCDFHSIDPEHRNDPDHVNSRPVSIGENVWVTVQCVIQKGSTIGRNSTIAPNSVVRGELPANTLAGGNPAIVWKHLRSSEISQPATPQT